MVKNGRSRGIRTPDLLVPNQTRYQTTLYSASFHQFWFAIFKLSSLFLDLFNKSLLLETKFIIICMVPFSYWIGFLIFLVIALSLDLLVFNKKDHTPTLKESLFWTIVWTSIAVGFRYVLNHQLGEKAGDEFITGYVLERILSVDNIFVFVLIFSYFKVPLALQHRALMIGIIVAIFLRAGFIFAGAALVEKFEWILYVFGAFLVYTGGKIIFSKEGEENLEDNKIVKLCHKFFNVIPEYYGKRLIVKENGKKALTMLGLVVISIGASDVIFAVDSIPAVFAVTTNTYIVFTANVFSVLGLCAIFFLIANVLNHFHYLKFALSIILVFIGVKMLIVKWIHIDTMHSLIFIIATFILAIVASVVRVRVLK